MKVIVRDIFFQKTKYKVQLLLSFTLFLFISNSFAQGGTGAADSAIELESVYISIKAVGRPITDVLQEIERKTGVHIKISRKVQEKITIELRHFPLLGGLDRLFSGIDHSIMYNGKKKEVLVMILNEGRQVADGTIGKDKITLHGQSGRVPMEAAVEAVRNYQGGLEEGQPVVGATSTTRSPMEASTQAMVNYQKELHIRPGLITYRESPTDSPMEASTKALVKYQGDRDEQLDTSALLSVVGGSPMEASAAAVSAYRGYGRTQSYQAPKVNSAPRERSPMDASFEAVAAYIEYNKKR